MIWVLLAAGLSAIEPATICGIAESPRQYEGKLVSVVAEVSVGHEWQRLQDPSCPSTPLWFEFAKGVPGSKKFWNMSRRNTAEVIGRVDTGSCFGHNCFSKAQIVVAEFRNIAFYKPDICLERRVALNARFRAVGVWMDTYLGLVPLPDRSRIQLMGPGELPLVAEAKGVFQLAVEVDKVLELAADPVSGLVSLPHLGPGVYPFSTAGQGFQSVSGCIVVMRAGVRRIYRIKLDVGN